MLKSQAEGQVAILLERKIMRSFRALNHPIRRLTAIPYRFISTSGVRSYTSKLPIKFNHDGQVNGGVASVLSRTVKTSGEIYAVRGLPLSDIMKPERWHLQPFINRGTHQNEKHITSLQVPNGDSTEDQITRAVMLQAHSKSPMGLLSTSYAAGIARFYAAFNAKGAIFTYDQRLLRGCTGMPDSEYSWECELTIERSIPPCAVVGYQPVSFVIPTGSFIFNELYIDPNLMPAEFFSYYEKVYLPKFQELLRNSLDLLPSDLRHRRGYQGVAPVYMNAFLKLNKELYQRANEFLKQRDVALQYNIDQVLLTLKKQYTPKEKFSAAKVFSSLRISAILFSSSKTQKERVTPVDYGTKTRPSF